jgi:nucleoside-diphosphate-sugar epimerase
VNRPLIVVLGEKGFIGNKIVSGFLSHGFRVIGVGRTTLCDYSVRGVKIENHEKFDLLGTLLANSQEYYLINCVRDDVLGLNQDYFAMLGRVARDAKAVVNFSTYIQHYTVGPLSQLSAYRDSQLQKSKYLQEICINANLLDIALYTVYGSGDSSNSFLSYIFPNLQQDKALELTGLEQLISYTFVDDVVKLTQSLVSEQNLEFGNYSFWQTPPLPLHQYFKVLVKFTNSKSKVGLGSLPYKGHELFNYNPEIFPPQIRPGFNWTKFEDGLASYLD